MKRLFGFLLNFLHTIDKWLLLACVLLSALSVVLIYSIAQAPNVAVLLEVTRRTWAVQGMAAAAGVTAALIMSRIDYHFMARMWKFFVPVAVGLVVLTYFVGLRVDETIDDRAWLPMPFGMTFQPSELLKICFILTLAKHLDILGEEMNQFPNVLGLCAHGAVPVLLVHWQGDDGSALIFVLIFAAMVFSAGLSWKYVIVAGTALLLAAPFFWRYAMTGDQRDRFLSVYFEEFADPLGIDYQQYLSRISIGSGRIVGNGLFQEEYWYVPKMHNDFIYSFVGQTMGLLGALGVLALFGVICLRMLRTRRNAVDVLGGSICVGVFAMIFFQMLINVGMCISVLPVVGITLPFMSAGGTSVLITYLGIGLVLSVYSHSRTTLFYE